MTQDEIVKEELAKIEEFIQQVGIQLEVVLLESDTHNPVTVKMTTDTLRPMLQGIFFAHAMKINPTDIEDTLMNVFCIGMMAYYKHRFHVKGGTDPVIKNAQETIDVLAQTLAIQITDHFKPAMHIPISKKRH